MKYHIIAFVLGFFLDLLLGDPYWLPHPIRLMGSCITKIEKWLRQEEKDNKRVCIQGKKLVGIMLGGTLCCTAGILFGAFFLHPFVGVLVETVMTYQILAMKCLKVESMKVYAALEAKDLEGARRAVSMIVGRDTKALKQEQIAKAAIETVAENTSDGVIAPMLYTAIGGPILGFCYKAINTMDSMVGYKNERYLYFGRAAAKLDDIANFLPARISAYLMIVVAFLFGKNFSAKGAYDIYKRDRRKHASPNSAHTEAVCAGALGIQLAGDASYFGKVVKKPYIGDALRKVENEDIKRSNQLMYGTAVLCEVLCVLGLVGILVH